MRLTIIKDGGLVVIDGLSIGGLDVSSLPENFHALQWYETRGDAEYVDRASGIVTNELVADLAPYQTVIDAWFAAKEEIDNSPPSPPSVPEKITRRQCAIQLLDLSRITDTEAIAMTRDGTPPASVQVYIDALPSTADRTRALIDFAATEYYRDNPLLAALMEANGNTPEQIDQFFIAASQL